MIIKWQMSADGQTKAVDDHYPRFEAWQPHNPVDNCWCLSIKRNAGDEDPIKVLALPSPEAVEELVAGFLKGSANYSDDNLSITIHFTPRETQTPCEAMMFPSPGESLRIHASTRVRSV